MRMREWCKNNRFLLKPFLTMFLIYMVGILALIVVNVHFADDVARTNYGYAGWNGFSRYLSTVLSHALHADNYLTNIAPLPQIIAMTILAVASVMMVVVISGKEVFREKWTRWIWQLIAVLPLGLSPYMLECLSYQYDAPYMAISIFAAVMPLLFRKSSRWIYGFSILVGVLVVCMTYQAAIGILPMLVVITAVKEWNEEKKVNVKGILKYVGFSALIFVVSLLFFQKFLMKSSDSYVSNSLPAIDELIPKFFEHLGRYMYLVCTDFKVLWKVLIILIAVAFVVLFVVKSRQNKIVAGVVGIVLVAVLGILSMAFYAVLDEPLWATRAMYPVGAFIAILAVYVASWEGKCRWLTLTPVVVLSWCFMIFAFTWANVLKEQDNYRIRQTNLVVQELNTLEIMKDVTPKVIQVTGNLGFSPVVLHLPRDNNMLQRLLMPTYSQYVPWMAYQLEEESGFSNLYHDETVDLKTMDLPVLKETVFYNIKGDATHILVEFKDERKFDVIF